MVYAGAYTCTRLLFPCRGAWSEGGSGLGLAAGLRVGGLLRRYLAVRPACRRLLPCPVAWSQVGSGLGQATGPRVGGLLCRYLAVRPACGNLLGVVGRPMEGSCTWGSLWPRSWANRPSGSAGELRAGSPGPTGPRWPEGPGDGGGTGRPTRWGGWARRCAGVRPVAGPAHWHGGWYTPGMVCGLWRVPGLVRLHVRQCRRACGPRWLQIACPPLKQSARSMGPF